MLMLLCVHVTRVLFLVLAGNSTLTWASIGVTHSYSSRPFLCTLDVDYCTQVLLQVTIHKIAIQGEFCAGNYCLTLQGICESVLYGTPHILKPTTCWKLDWEELERNHHHFNALCQLLQNRVRTRDSSSQGVADPKPLQL